MSQSFSLGPATVRLSGAGFGHDELAAELEAVRELGGATPDAEIRVSTRLGGDRFQPEIYSAKERFNFNPECFFRSDPVPHRIWSWTGQQPAVAEFAVRAPGARQFIHLQPASPVMNYGQFWGWMHFVLGRQGAGFVHAGISTRGNGSSCFIGTGGCGKTSTLFTLLEDARENYQSEDFGIVDRNGRSHYCQKRVSIYSTDTRSSLLSAAVNSQLTLRQKSLWEYRILRKKNPRIKLSPRSVVGERIAGSDEIAHAFYLVRGSNSAVEVSALSAEELANRAACVARRELAVWAEALLLIAANDVIKAAFPTLAQFEEDLRSLYRSAFARAERWLVRVPYRCGGADLLTALRAAGKLDT